MINNETRPLGYQDMSWFSCVDGYYMSSTRG